MNVTIRGKLGIGTITPAIELHIAGSATIDRTLQLEYEIWT